MILVAHISPECSIFLSYLAHSDKTDLLPFDISSGYPCQNAEMELLVLGCVNGEIWF